MAHSLHRPMASLTPKSGLIPFLSPLVFTACVRTEVPEIVNPEPPIVYVSADGSGNYTTDGKKDQIEINAALDYVASHDEYTTVHLVGKNTFIIDETLFISENTTLEGDADTSVKLEDHARWWRRFKPMIGQKGTEYTFGMLESKKRTSGITIRGFELDGNRGNQREPSGNLYYTLIQLQNCYNINIHDMYIHDSLADLIQVTFYADELVPIHSQFHNNRLHNSGHDGIFLQGVRDFEVFDNIITNSRTNSGVRVVASDYFEVYNNIIGNDPDRRVSGSAGIQIQSDVTHPLLHAELHHNYIYGHQNWHGIWLQQNHDDEQDEHRDVHIHHNVISWYTKAAIGIYGFNNTLIENNVLELSEEGAGVTFYEGVASQGNKKLTTTVRNNIIINNATNALDNQASDVHSFVSDYNCITGNSDGHYQNASSSTDIYKEPELAVVNERHYKTHSFTAYKTLSDAWTRAERAEDFSGDLGAKEAWRAYHLRSEEGRWTGSEWVSDTTTSPCIDKGGPSDDYSAEPSPNGGRLNIGAFGGTEEASLSPE